MPDYLLSARTKLGRANEHAKALGSQVAEFADSVEGQLYRIAHYRNREATEHSFRIKSTIAPLVRWSLVFADCLQNHRAALDHAIFGLAVSRAVKNPPPC